jgi:molybdopterin synthase catalytic subunit
MTIVARLLDDKLDPSAEYDAVMSDCPGAGAIVTFVGIARAETPTGSQVQTLRLESHSRLTLASLEEIARDGGSRFPVTLIRIAHRHGDIQPGEPIVFVGTAAPHRRAAFEAADYVMDRLKTEAVFWKREDAVDGSRWIEATEADHVDRGRWSD